MIRRRRFYLPYSMASQCAHCEEAGDSGVLSKGALLLVAQNIWGSRGKTEV